MDTVKEVTHQSSKGLLDIEQTFQKTKEPSKEKLQVQNDATPISKTEDKREDKINDLDMRDMTSSLMGVSYKPNMP